MSLHTNVDPVVPEHDRDSLPDRLSEPPIRGSLTGVTELDLRRRVELGEQAAARQVAERMGARVVRVANVLMGDSLDGEDAALHALLDLLRAFPSYRGRARFERWVDRVAAVSILRFARAVRRRDGRVTEAGPAPLDPRAKVTIESLLASLRTASREILLFRHALGFPFPRLADALQCSVVGAREQLRLARGELRDLVARAELGTTKLEPSTARWWSLRDREATGEPLSAEDAVELERLESEDAGARLIAQHVRALERFFDLPPERPIEVPRTLVERAVLTLEVTDPSARIDARASEAELERAMEPAGSRAVRAFSLSASVLLALSSALALWFYEPRGSDPAAASQRSVAGEPGTTRDAGLAPTVEALSTARTSRRGARLRRRGRILAEGSAVKEGDLLEAPERAACLVLGPDLDVCLSPWAAVQLALLRSGDYGLVLQRGRLSARAGPSSAALRLRVRTGELSVRAIGSTFGVDRSPDGSLTRARALRGALEVEVGEVSQLIPEGRAVSYRATERAIEVLLASPTLAQRDLDLLATPALLHPAAARASSSRVDAGALAASSPLPSEPPSLALASSRATLDAPDAGSPLDQEEAPRANSEVPTVRRSTPLYATGQMPDFAPLDASTRSQRGPL